MPQAHYDVAIVGASIAGSTAATLFARRGLRVALIERNVDPNAYKKICTHFIQPSALPTIERLGIAEKIEAAGAVRGGIDVFTRWGWIRDSVQMNDGYPSRGYNIRRQTLDPILRKLAADTPGVELMQGRTARDLISEGNRFTGVEVEGKEGNKQQIRANLVVGADGRDSRVATLAGVSEKTKPHGRFIYFAHYRNLPLASGDTSQMWLLEPDVAYAFPNDDGVTVLACMPAKEKLLAFKEDVKGSFERFFQDLPLGPKIGEAERVSKVMGKLQMPNISREPAGAGLAFIGDAALSTDPLWGVGCGWAFQSAEWLVESTTDALIADASLEHALKRYAKKHRSALAGHHSLIADFASGRSYNPIEKLMFSAAAKDLEMAHHFFLFGGRHIGVRKFLAPSALAHALRVNMRRRNQTNSASSKRESRTVA